eukprot:CFRG6216T1
MALQKGPLDLIGRYVTQVRKITVYYCRQSGSSKGVREFIDKDLVNIAKNHPEVAFDVRLKHRSHAFVKGEFANDYVKTMTVKNESAADIRKRVIGLITQVGAKNRKLTKWWQTQNPSIQGDWNHFL